MLGFDHFAVVGHDRGAYTAFRAALDFPNAISKLVILLFGDVLAIWRPWTSDLRGHGIDCGHHMAEEAPELLADELRRFLLKA